MAKPPPSGGAAPGPDQRKLSDSAGPSSAGAGYFATLGACHGSPHHAAPPSRRVRPCHDSRRSPTLTSACLAGLGFGAEGKVVQKSFRSLALKNHPDKLPEAMGSPARAHSIARFQAAAIAHHVLTSEASRLAYMSMYRIRCHLFQIPHAPGQPLAPFYVLHVKKRDALGREQQRVLTIDLIEGHLLNWKKVRARSARSTRRGALSSGYAWRVSGRMCVDGRSCACPRTLHNLHDHPAPARLLAQPLSTRGSPCSRSHPANFAGRGAPVHTAQSHQRGARQRAVHIHHQLLWRGRARLPTVRAQPPPIPLRYSAAHARHRPHDPPSATVNAASAPLAGIAHVPTPHTRWHRTRRHRHNGGTDECARAVATHSCSCRSVDSAAQATLYTSVLQAIADGSAAPPTDDAHFPPPSLRKGFAEKGGKGGDWARRWIILGASNLLIFRDSSCEKMVNAVPIDAAVW